jgi:hypothetical protein
MFYAQKFLLKFDLQFFAAPDDGGGTPPADPPADPTPPADPKPEPLIPKNRFDEVNNNYKTVKAQLDQLLQEKDEAERKSKEQQGEYQSLYEKTNGEFTNLKTTYEQADSRLKELEGVIGSLLENKLKAIPEDYHDLIPSNLTAEQKLDWVNKAEAKGLFGKKEPQQPLGGGTNPPAPKSNLSNLSSFQLLQAGYGSKK